MVLQKNKQKKNRKNTRLKQLEEFYFKLPFRIQEIIDEHLDDWIYTVSHRQNQNQCINELGRFSTSLELAVGRSCKNLSFINYFNFSKELTSVLVKVPHKDDCMYCDLHSTTFVNYYLDSYITKHRLRINRMDKSAIRLDHRLAKLCNTVIINTTVEELLLMLYKNKHLTFMYNLKLFVSCIKTRLSYIGITDPLFPEYVML